MDSQMSKNTIIDHSWLDKYNLMNNFNNYEDYNNYLIKLNKIRSVSFFDQVVMKKIFNDNKYEIKIKDLKTGDDDRWELTKLLFKKQPITLNEIRLKKERKKSKYVKNLIRSLDLNNKDDLLLLRNTVANRLNKSIDELDDDFLDNILDIIDKEFNDDIGIDFSNSSLEVNYSSNELFNSDTNSTIELMDISLNLGDKNEDYNTWTDNYFDSSNVNYSIKQKNKFHNNDMEYEDMEFEDTEYDKQNNSVYDYQMNTQNDNQMNTQNDNQYNLEYDNLMNKQFDKPINTEYDNLMNKQFDKPINTEYDNQIDKEYDYQLSSKYDNHNNSKYDKPINTEYDNQIDKEYNYQLSSKYDNQLNSKCDNQINKQFDKPINKKYYKPINEEYDYQIDKEYDNQLSSKYDNQLNSKCDNQINKQFDKPINKKYYKPINEEYDNQINTEHNKSNLLNREYLNHMHKSSNERLIFPNSTNEPLKDIFTSELNDKIHFDNLIDDDSDETIEILFQKINLLISKL